MNRALISALLAALCVSAQDHRNHTLSGRVLDPASAPVPNATVRLYDRDTSLQRSAVSDAQGAFRIERLPAGQFLVEARTDGLDQASPVAVTLAAGQAANIDLRLEIRGLSARVLVTASSTPQSTMESGKAMDVVDREELSRRNEITFAEAVRLVPGLRMQQLGGPGSFTRILTRGLRAADTGLLIDGMRLRDVASVQGDATAFLGDLQLVNTERIEILRGLGSTIYGTNATAGVLNLVTDQGGGGVHGEVSGEGGGLGLARGLARAAGGLNHDRLQYSAGLASLLVNGGVDGAERVHNNSGQGYLLWRPNSTSSLSGRVLGTTSTVGINSSPSAAPLGNLPGTGTIQAIPLAHDQMLLGDSGSPFQWGNATFAPNFRDPDGRRIGNFVSTMIHWNHQVLPRVNYRVSYQAVTSDRDTRNGPSGLGYQPMFNSSSLFGGRLDTLQARADLSLARWNLLSAGWEWEREFYQNVSRDENPSSLERVNARASARQRSNSVFLQDQLKMLGDRLQLALSGRLQNFHLARPDFEGGAPMYAGASFAGAPNSWTGDATLSYYLPAQSTKLRAHSGNGFRSPTLYERIGTSFYFGSFSPLGDPRLRPERTVSLDFGVDRYFANSRYRVSSTYFYTRLQEVIGYAGLFNDPFGRYGGYVNLGGGLARGAEVSVEARPMRSLILSSSYTYTNADERQSSLVGGSLRSIRVFPHMFTLVATQQVTARLQLTADYLAGSDYVSGSFFVGSGNRPYQFAGPRRLDASVNYTVPVSDRRSVRFFTRVENVLGRNYFEDGFRTPGVWASAGLKLFF